MSSGSDGTTQMTSSGAVLEECEELLAAHKALDRCVSIEPRRNPDQHADLRLLFADRAWLRSQAGGELLADLEEHPIVSSVQRHRSAVLVRFDDGALANLEHRLADCEMVGMGTADILYGHRFRVSFVNPNTNKALHVGHLRNIMYGQALASMLSFAGATVERNCIVGDIGRRVCEAMGGYLADHQGESPQTTGLAGDRFVELCCRDFPHGPAALGEIGVTEDPNAEERSTRGDLADEIMGEWLSGAAPVRALWERMRAWVLSGHEQTLTRLGVLMDSYDFESQDNDRSRAIIANGLEQGLFERDASGSVIYQTERPEYTTMVIMRADNALTEFGRCIGLYDRDVRRSRARCGVHRDSGDRVAVGCGRTRRTGGKGDAALRRPMPVGLSRFSHR